MNTTPEQAAAEARADAGLTQGTDRAIAYESGFESGVAWAREQEFKASFDDIAKYQSQHLRDNKRFAELEAQLQGITGGLSVEEFKRLVIELQRNQKK